MRNLAKRLTFLKPGLVLSVVTVLVLSAGCSTTYTVKDDNVVGGPTTSDGPARPDVNKQYEARYQLALAYYQGGQAEFALEEVNKALEFRPGSADAIALKGMIYEQMNDSASALHFFKRAIALAPNNGDHLHSYGASLCRNKQYSEGIARLQQAANMGGNANTARTWGALGACYMAGGDSIQAENAFHQALKLDPRNGFVLYQLANLMLQRNDLDGAHQYFSQLESLGNPGAAGLWLGIKIARQRGDAYSMGQYARVLRERYPNSLERAALERGDFNL